MIARLALFLAMLLAAVPAAAGISTGKLDDLGIVQSRYADPRKVTVWLPASYRPGGPRHSVLYMHDGQNLFDPETGFGGMEWKIDEVLGRLIAQNKVRPTIVVAIWNTPKRLREYVPSKAFRRLPPAYMERVRGLYGGDPLSDGYLKFIVRELKPRIDRAYQVRTGRSDTAIMGSSMGALISLYAISEYPHVFGGAGMVSTHWPLMIPPEGKTLSDSDYETVSSAFERYLAPSLPSPRTHRLYFDHGSETLDAVYARYQMRIDRVVARRGYRLGRNWISRNFPGQAHNEISWASRVEIPLRFLLPPRKGAHGR
ncbi:alpha/beta hydrolase-fold protein [Sphingomonas sp.]|uniref:alpha/beta hydrolase n=1 Tax=Sphingomonas sp. TaxID=28214 RepID=UPI001847EB77|nr:alpha/beta hydrolase-fold protein [Sphingomonas sp.]MBA3512216.1 alpha/beta hydrolase [Sphingomonas sp.]